MSDRPYSRVYWSVMDDAKFDGIRENMRHFGSWTLLLMVADMSHPAPAFVPGGVPNASLNALSECGLIDLLSGGRYRVHGLASEREQRSESARNAAAKRWHSAGNANPLLDEHRQDKQSSTRASAPKKSSVDRDPLLREMRDAIVEVNGKGMDDQPVPTGWRVRK